MRLLAAEEAVPPAKQLTSAAVSVPGVLLTQIAAIRALARQGMDLAATRRWRWPAIPGRAGRRSPAAPGRRGRPAARPRPADRGRRHLVARRRGISVLGDRPPMVSVTNAEPERIYELLQEFARTSAPCCRRCCRSATAAASVVITGTP